MEKKVEAALAQIRPILQREMAETSSLQELQRTI